MNSEMHVAGRLTALGWTTFALYLLAAMLSFRAAVASRSPDKAAAGRVWIWLAVILALLGWNKPLDAQTWLIELGRRLAGREYLSTHATGLHFLFFLAFILPALLLLAVIIFRFSADLGGMTRQLPLAAGGCVLICLYILIRAASIDRVDQMLGFNLEPIPFLWLLEAGGLLLVIGQALLSFVR